MKMKRIIMPRGMKKKLCEITGASECTVMYALRGSYESELVMRIRKEAMALGGLYAKERIIKR